MDAPEVLTALISALTFMLSEIRRRGSNEYADLRSALFDLEDVVSTWWVEAQSTNRIARDVAERGTITAGPDEETLEEMVSFRDFIHLQERSYETVEQMFGRRWGRPAHSRTIADFLRIYAPEVLDLAPRLVVRQRQLQSDIFASLERRLDEDGSPLALEYVAELDDAVAGIERFAHTLAAFIAEEFPP